MMLPPFIENWKAVLLRAWSVRFSAISALATTILLVWPTAMLDTWNVLPDTVKAFVPVKISLVIPLLLTVAAIWARIAVQKKTDDVAK